MTTANRLTVGVEEEFLLLDPHTGENAPLAGKVFGGLPDPLRRRGRQEFRPSMVEMVTDVCTDLGDLGEQLLVARRAAASAAADVGARLVAVGATPVAEPHPTAADDARFRDITRHYGPIARDPAVCGCHVHVGVPDRGLAVQICTRLRGWLPVIQALSVNSPMFCGADTGYASWRFAQLQRWPALGPWPHLETPEDYRRTVATLVSSGAMLDDSMVLWYARPSATYPTVEIRVADVCLTAADTVVLAGLVRGLVAMTGADALAGRPAPVIADALLEGAHWNAARDGMDGTLLDVRTGRARPAWDLVDDLVDWITPALGDDLGTVHTGLDRIRREGTGAARQRRLFDDPGFLDLLARETLAAQ